MATGLAEYLESHPEMVKYIDAGEPNGVLGIFGVPENLHTLFQDDLLGKIVNGKFETLKEISLDVKSIKDFALSCSSRKQ